MNTFNLVSGAIVVSVPGMIDLPGFPLAVFVRYVLTGTLRSFLLKNSLIPVTKHPPSKFSTLNVCVKGEGFLLDPVSVSTICLPSFVLRFAGRVEVTVDVLVGRTPVG